MVVHHCGVLLQGPSGVGKSSVALQLLDRGHRFVADDTVSLVPSAHGVLGKVKPQGRGKLYCRELGIIEVAQHFSKKQVLIQHPVYCIINLTLSTLAAPPCLELPLHYKQLAGHSLPSLTFTMTSSAYIALLIEHFIIRRGKDCV